MKLKTTITINNKTITLTNEQARELYSVPAVKSEIKAKKETPMLPTQHRRSQVVHPKGSHEFVIRTLRNAGADGMYADDLNQLMADEGYGKRVRLSVLKAMKKQKIISVHSGRRTSKSVYVLEEG